MIDARDRVTGRLDRVARVRLPGMLTAAIVRSPIPAGTIRGVDTSEALASPGVVAVVSGADLISAGLGDVLFGTIVQDQPILAIDRVRHVGEPVAVVLATDARTARRAAALVVLDIEPSEPLLDPDAALADGSPPIHDAKPDNVLSRWHIARGDVETARDTATHRFGGRWTSPAAQVVSLEPHAVVAHWPAPDHLELWSTTQSPSRSAQEVARVLGLPPTGVRLHVPPLGGAFGGKNHAKLEPLVAFASRAVGRPVRLVNRRAEEFVTITKHPVTIDLESGVDGDGRFVFRTARIVADGGAYANSSPVIPKAAGSAVLGPYRMRVAHVGALVAYTNQPPAGSFRGLGVSQAAWAGERQVDEIAAALGIDPIEFRRRNLVVDGDRLPNGDLVTDAHWLGCLEAALEGDGPTGVDDPPWIRRGRGCAVVMKATMAPFSSGVRLGLQPDGTLVVEASAVDMGQGARSALARMAAAAMGIAVEDVRIVDPDTLITPFDATTSSSRTVNQHYHAIAEAADRLRAELERLARQVGEGGFEPAYRDGRLVDEARGTSLSAGEVVAAAGLERLDAEAAHVNHPPLDPDSGEPAMTSHWHQGALVVDVAVDMETGAVSIDRARGAAWAGIVVDPIGASRQNDGNVIYGLGPAMFEALELPASGPRPTSLRDYRIPNIRDVPTVLETVALEAGGPAVAGDPDTHIEPGGLGESLVTAVAPAIGNAIAAAVGVRPRELPMTADRVLDLIATVASATSAGRATR